MLLVFPLRSFRPSAYHCRYGRFHFRSGAQDGMGASEVKSVRRVRDGLTYEVEMLDMGKPHKALVTLVKTGSGGFLFDDVK